MIELDETLQSWLSNYLAEAGAVAGTVHLHEKGRLRLAAAKNVPPEVLEAVTWLPSGKGMAGLVLERGEVIHTRNLQEDRSGAIHPGAKAVNAQAAVTLPVQDIEGRIIAVVGVAFADEREIQAEEIDRLRTAAAAGLSTS